MAERVIDFAAPMLAAVILGRKTVTRRPIKSPDFETLQAIGGGPEGEPASEDSIAVADHPEGVAVWSRDYPDEGSAVLVCPYGVPGDHLRVPGTSVVLEVASVTVERLLGLTNNECQAEGFPGEHGRDEPDVEPWEQFARFWDGVYSGTRYAWDKSPWVWRVAFRKLEDRQEVTSG